MQKLRSSIYILVLMASAFGLVFLSGCEKEPKNNNNNNETTTPTQVELTKSDLVPYELLAFKMNNTWSSAPDSIKVGMMNVAVRSSDSFLVGFCPNLLPGEYPISIENGKFTSKVTIKEPTIVDPTVVYDSLMLYMETKSTSSIAGSVDILKSSIETEWQKLSPLQKVEVAQIIYANKWHINTFPQFDENAYLDSVRRRSGDYSVDELLGEVFRNHSDRVAKLAASIILTAVGYYSTPATGPLGALVCGVGIYKLLDNWDKFKKETEHLSTWTIQLDKIFSLDSRSSLVLNNEKSTPIKLTGMYSVYSQLDESKADAGWLFKLMDKAQKSIDLLNEGIKLVNKKSFISVPLISVTAKKLLSSTESSNMLPMAFDNVSITGVSNPNIKLTLERDGKHQIKIKASSTLTEETNFTFDVKYQSKHVSAATATKTISAVFKPASNDFYGDWVCYNINDFDKKDITKQVCIVDGNNIPYEIIDEVDYQESSISISSDSVIWFWKAHEMQYSNNRPDDCGGKYYGEGFLNKLYPSKIYKIENNRILTYMNIDQYSYDLYFDYQLIDENEMHVTVVDPQEQFSRGPFKYKRK
jgi:hypothetical protein